LAGFEQGPRRRREAHPAHVEMREPRAALVEDVIDPGKDALAGLRIALLDVSIDYVIRQPVAFDHDEAFRLCARGKGAEKKYSRKDAKAQREYAPPVLFASLRLCQKLFTVHRQG